MAIVPLQGVYSCSKCDVAYTTDETKKLEGLDKDKEGFPQWKCSKCRGMVGVIRPHPEPRPPESAGLKLIITEPQDDMEKYYYYMLEELGNSKYSPEKVRDVYTASEASSLWGDIERRKQMQADQAMKYLATIGSMMKSLFQLLRELRIIDERLEHYYGRIDKEGKKKEDGKPHDIALKGIWIDKVEGGAQKPSSVYGMATQLGFVTLPDLFYGTYVIDDKELDKVIKSMQEKQAVNEKVLEVLQRKLAEFLTWVKNTKSELESGRDFKLAYLRQHFHIIRMYLDWVRPYIRNVQSMNVLYSGPGGRETEGEVTRAQTEMLRASEASVMDVEVFALPEKRVGGYYSPCIRVRFYFTTAPTMQYRKEYQPGPVHVGRVVIELDGFVLTEEQIKKYTKAKFEQDIAALRTIEGSFKYLDDTMIGYLKEANDEFVQAEVKSGEKDKGKDKKGIFKSVAEFFKRKEEPVAKKQPSKRQKEEYMEEAKKKLYSSNYEDTGQPGGVVWDTYDHYKKYFEFVRW